MTEAIGLVESAEETEAGSATEAIGLIESAEETESGSVTEATGPSELTETRTGTESMAGIPGTGTENAVARGNATERG